MQLNLCDKLKHFMKSIQSQNSWFCLLVHCLGVSFKQIFYTILLFIRRKKKRNEQKNHLNKNGWISKET